MKITRQLFAVISFYFIFILEVFPQDAVQENSLDVYLQKANSAYSSGDFKSALDNFLYASLLQESANDEQGLVKTYHAVAEIYEHKKLYPKSLEYSLKEKNILDKMPNSQPEKLAELYQHIGLMHYFSKDYENAIIQYEKAFHNYQLQGRQKASADVLSKMSLISQDFQQHDKALKYGNEALILYSSSKDTLGMCNIYNNIGFLYRQTNNQPSSFEQFEKALKLNQQLASYENSPSQKAVILTNIGVLNTNLNNNRDALKSFQEALSIWENQKNTNKIAETYRYISKLHLLDGVYDRAELEAIASLSLARKSQNREQALASMELLTEIYSATGNYKKAQELQQMHKLLSDSLNSEKSFAYQQQLQQQVEAEKKEGEFRSALAEKQKQDLILEQLRLESEKKEKELALNQQQLELLKRDQELQKEAAKRQKLEKERVQRELMFAQQKLQSEIREKELEKLQQEQALQKLEQEKRNLKEAESTQALKALEAEKLAQEETLKGERNLRFLGTGILFLVLALAMYVIYSLRKQKKANQMLEEQKKNIQEKNEELTTVQEELRQNYDELSSREEELKQNAEELNAVNEKLSDEMYKTDQAFYELKEAQKTLQQYNQELLTREEEIRQNAEELLAVNEKLAEEKERAEQTLLELNTTQNQLVHSEKMAALGQITANVAHEVNTPLGAIKSSSKTLEQRLNRLPTMFNNITNTLSAEEQAVFFELVKKAATRNESGGLSVKEQRSIKKELKNKLENEGFNDFEHLADDIVEIGLQDELHTLIPILKHTDANLLFDTLRSMVGMLQSVKVINIAVDKAAKVVYALKSYSHHSEIAHKEWTDLIENVEVVLTLYHNQMKHGVDLVKNYPDNLPKIMAYADELGQVWTNIITNSLHAMNHKGKLEVTIQQEGNELAVYIADNGQGMSKEIQEKIFQPFFTTKAKGVGSGLGLDIVKKILAKHSGNISVKSEVGQGATFRVGLPINTSQSDS
jgi:signal transduction histidine kinase/tetratricopeptide (TPR) repeat protein/Na+-transporting methylmalonyl-CoA/oxaloacetate decarboxylase gamma subunit